MDSSSLDLRTIRVVTMVEIEREMPGRLGRLAMGVVRGLSSSSERGIGNLIDVSRHCVWGLQEDHFTSFTMPGWGSQINRDTPVITNVSGSCLPLFPCGFPR